MQIKKSCKYKFKFNIKLRNLYFNPLKYILFTSLMKINHGFITLKVY